MSVEQTGIVAMLRQMWISHGTEHVSGTPMFEDKSLSFATGINTVTSDQLSTVETTYKTTSLKLGSVRL